MARLCRAAIGLEIHAQLALDTKLLSPSTAAYFASAPNSHVDPHDSGEPGTLPALNSRAVHLALRAAVALKCNVQRVSAFDRKHYDYPDLPCGYQITQRDRPLARRGYISLDHHMAEGQAKVIRLRQLHLEQDTARAMSPALTGVSLDFNRCGVALIEIVTEPVIKSPEVAVAAVKHVSLLLREIGVSEARMDRGSLRVDANVTMHECTSGSTIHDPNEAVVLPPALSKRVELKNIASTAALRAALRAEIARQSALVAAGECGHSHTRTLTNAKTGECRETRDKTSYVYMREPDLAPLRVHRSCLAKAKASLPFELPNERYHRLVTLFRNHGPSVSAAAAAAPVDQLFAVAPSAPARIAKFFDAARALTPPDLSPRVLVHWISSEIPRKELQFVCESSADHQLKESAEYLASILTQLQETKKNAKEARDLLKSHFASIKP